MHDERTFGLRISLRQILLYGVVGGLAGHGEQTGRLVYHHDAVVFKKHGGLQRALVFRCGKRFHIQSLQHEVENGAALAGTGRIELPVVPNLAHGRGSPPELGHAARAHLQQVSGLQQLGRTALSRPSRRRALRCVGKKLGECGVIASCVEHHEAVEEPPLQGIRPLVAFLLQTLQQISGAEQRLLFLLQQGGETFFDAVQLGFHKLALGDESLLLAFGQDAPLYVGPYAVALLLGGLHLQAVGFHGCRFFLLQCLEPCLALFHQAALLDDFHLPVDVRDAGLLLFEVALGLQEVEHGRHEKGPVVSVGQQSGVGGQETGRSVFLFHHQHPEHLAPFQFVAPCRLCLQVVLRQSGSLQAEGMGHIAERIVQPPRRACGCGERMDVDVHSTGLSVRFHPMMAEICGMRHMAIFF